MKNHCYIKLYVLIRLTFKSFEAPVVTFSGPNINSSAARPPIIVSIIANILDFVTWYSSFAGMYAVYQHFYKIHIFHI